MSNFTGYSGTDSLEFQIFFKYVTHKISGEFCSILHVFVNFAEFHGFTWISQLRDCVKYQKPYYNYYNNYYYYYKNTPYIQNNFLMQMLQCTPLKFSTQISIWDKNSKQWFQSDYYKNWTYMYTNQPYICIYPINAQNTNHFSSRLHFMIWLHLFLSFWLEKL